MSVICDMWYAVYFMLRIFSVYITSSGFGLLFAIFFTSAISVGCF